MAAYTYYMKHWIDQYLIRTNKIKFKSSYYSRDVLYESQWIRTYVPEAGIKGRDK